LARDSTFDRPDTRRVSDLDTLHATCPPGICAIGCALGIEWQAGRSCGPDGRHHGVIRAPSFFNFLDLRAFEVSVSGLPSRMAPGNTVPTLRPIEVLLGHAMQRRDVGHLVAIQEKELRNSVSGSKRRDVGHWIAFSESMDSHLSWPMPVMLVTWLPSRYKVHSFGSLKTALASLIWLLVRQRNQRGRIAQRADVLHLIVGQFHVLPGSSACPALDVGHLVVGQVHELQALPGP